MLTDDEKTVVAQATLTMQIIVGALAGGVIMFFVVTLFVTAGGEAGPPEMPLLTYMSLAFAPAAILVAMLFPGVLIRSQRETMLAGVATSQSIPADKPPAQDSQSKLMRLVGGYQTALIIRSAILEGAAFFSLLAYMLEGQALILLVVGVLLLFLLSGMPTRSRVEDFIDQEQRVLDELREMRTIDAR
jgi:hypothetical protein